MAMAAAARAGSRLRRLDSQSNGNSLAAAVDKSWRSFSADHGHGPARVNMWEAPGNPGKWKEEHFVFVSIAGWGALFFGGYKAATGGGSTKKASPPSSSAAASRSQPKIEPMPPAKFHPKPEPKPAAKSAAKEPEPKAEHRKPEPPKRSDASKKPPPPPPQRKAEPASKKKQSEKKHKED